MYAYLLISQRLKKREIFQIQKSPVKSPLRQSQPTSFQGDRMATRSSPRKQGQQQQQASTSLGLPTGMDSLPSDLLFDEAKADFG